MTDTPERIVLNDAAMWPPARYSDRLQPTRDWLNSHGIDPSEVTTEQPLTVETADDGQRIIRYTVYLCGMDGHRYADPNEPNQAAREERTTPLVTEPPAAALPDHDHQAGECSHCKAAREKDRLLYMRLIEAARVKR
ncbi:hypothetical protein [Streptomyces decoyicus]